MKKLYIQWLSSSVLMLGTAILGHIYGSRGAVAVNLILVWVNIIGTAIAMFPVFMNILVGLGHDKFPWWMVAATEIALVVILGNYGWPFTACAYALATLCYETRLRMHWAFAD